MKILSIYILFLLSFHGNAKILFNEQVKVEKNGDDVFLVGSECGVLIKEDASFKAWTKSLNEDTQSSNKCNCKNNICRLKVTSTLPNFVVANQFKHIPNDGPNCWNATLVASKIVPQIRYTSDVEINFWLNSPLCRERKADEPLSPGDIIAIRSQTEGEVHGFVHVSENLSFSKNGYSSISPYSLQDPNAVFDLYDVDKSCRRVRGRSKDCAQYANYFTCKSYDEFFKDSKIQSKEARDALDQVNDIECKISEAVISGGDSSEISKLVKMNLDILFKLSYDVLTKNLYEKSDKIVWQAIYHKANSLKDQLGIF